jgi:hypothetical protein
MSIVVIGHIDPDTAGLIRLAKETGIDVVIQEPVTVVDYEIMKQNTLIQFASRERHKSEPWRSGKKDSRFK